jgi:hypothetical protein
MFRFARSTIPATPRRSLQRQNLSYVGWLQMRDRLADDARQSGYLNERGIQRMLVSYPFWRDVTNLDEWMWAGDRRAASKCRSVMSYMGPSGRQRCQAAMSAGATPRARRARSRIRLPGLRGLGAIEWTPLTIAAAAGAAVLGAVYLGPRLKKLVG